MKAYTDLEQSKKLAERLPYESADMIYTLVNGHNTPFVRVESVDEMIEGDIPCWSLAALLEQIPNSTLKKQHKHYMCSAELFYGIERTNWHDNAIDACVEMICWLKENKYI